MKFASDEECEKLRNAPDQETFSILLNEILSRVHSSSIETTMRKLPDILSRMVANTTTTQAMTNEFFKNNPEFKDHKNIVAAVVEELDSKEPGRDYDKILEDAKPIIEEKIRFAGSEKDMPVDLPTKVNLGGNGAI